MNKITAVILATVFLGTASNAFAMDPHSDPKTITPKAPPKVKLSGDDEQKLNTLNTEHDLQASMRRVNKLMADFSLEYKKALDTLVKGHEESLTVLTKELLNALMTSNEYTKRETTADFLNEVIGITEKILNPTPVSSGETHK